MTTALFVAMLTILCISCDDNTQETGPYLRAFYERLGVIDFDAYGFERERIYPDVKGDLCAFDTSTGEFWTASNDKIFKFDSDGHYSAGGLSVRSRAADLAVNAKTHTCWVFCENGAVSQIGRSANPEFYPVFSVLPYAHTGKREYFLKPDNNHGGCWVIVKNEVCYLREWGFAFKKEFPKPITAAAPAADELGCWFATTTEEGAGRVFFLTGDGQIKYSLTGLTYLSDVRTMVYVEDVGFLWVINNEYRNGYAINCLSVITISGVLKGTYANIPVGSNLVVDGRGENGWVYGVGSSYVLRVHYENQPGTNTAALRMVGSGDIGAEIDTLDLYGQNK